MLEQFVFYEDQLDSGWEPKSHLLSSRENNAYFLFSRIFNKILNSMGFPLPISVFITETFSVFSE